MYSTSTGVYAWIHSLFLPLLQVSNDINDLSIAVLVLFSATAECTSTADTYVMGVEMFGCNGYQESQAHGCECLPKAEASTRFANYLKDFRLTYNGTELSEDILRK